MAGGRKDKERGEEKSLYREKRERLDFTGETVTVKKR